VGADAESRYKKIVASCQQIERLLVDVFVKSRFRSPKQIVLDLDATDDPLHGKQLGGFFHGYYQTTVICHCTFSAAEHLLCAKLRPADIDGQCRMRGGAAADCAPDPPAVARKCGL